MREKYLLRIRSRALHALFFEASRMLSKSDNGMQLSRQYERARTHAHTHIYGTSIIAHVTQVLIEHATVSYPSHYHRPTFHYLIQSRKRDTKEAEEDE